MKNVTITLNDEVARWARVEAAKAGKSLSRYVGDLLAERCRRLERQHEVFERFLNAPELPGVTADLPSREELYAERLFHRHERPALRKGPKSTHKTKTRAGMDRRPRR